MRPYKLTDEQWQQTDHLLPDIRGTNEGNAITTTNVPNVISWLATFGDKWTYCTSQHPRNLDSAV